MLTSGVGYTKLTHTRVYTFNFLNNYLTAPVIAKNKIPDGESNGKPSEISLSVNTGYKNISDFLSPPKLRGVLGEGGDRDSSFQERKHRPGVFYWIAFVIDGIVPRRPFVHFLA